MTGGFAAAPPDTPVAAATHPDPYHYYAELVRERPVYRDEALGMWVVASRVAVEAALTSPACRVRPRDQQVPPALRQTELGAVFGRFARTSDGPDHSRRRGLVNAALSRLEPARVSAAAVEWSGRLAPGSGTHAAPSLEAYACMLAPHVIATCLGFPEPALSRIAVWVGELAEGVSPLAGAGQVEAAITACARLSGLMAGASDEETANRIALLLQSYEATAGTIGNGVLMLRRQPELRDLLRERPGLIGRFTEEVLRYDPPVQNTRRYLDADAVIAGCSMHAGETILVVLAAANRDPALNPDPDRFELERPARRMLTFGAGPHACPGRDLAGSIAAAGLHRLMEEGLVPAGPPGPVRYRPSLNTRIPLGGGGDD